MSTIFSGEMGGVIVEGFTLLSDHFSEEGEKREFRKAFEKLQGSEQALIAAVLGESISEEEMLAALAQYPSHLRMTAALIGLRSDLMVTKNRLLLKFIVAMLRQPRTFKGINRLYGGFIGQWEWRLLYNPLLDAQSVQTLWDLFTNDYTRSILEGPHTRDMAWNTAVRLYAKIPECPTPVLNELLKYDDPIVRKDVGHHRNLNDELRSFFMNSKRKKERLLIAESRHTPRESLLAMMQDPDEAVITTARRNFKKRFPSELEKLTTEQITIAVARYRDSDAVKPVEKKPILDLDSIDTSEAFDPSTIKNSRDRVRLANYSREPHVLVALAKDKSKAVRREVAKNYTAPREVLHDLVRDSDIVTANSALANYYRTQSEPRPLEELLGEETINAYLDRLADRLEVERDLGQLGGPDDVRCELIGRHCGTLALQQRIIQSGEGKPTYRSLRSELFEGLVENDHLHRSVVLYLVFDLSYGAEKVLYKTGDTALMEEFLATGMMLSGTRIRLTDHLEKLKRKGG